MLTAFRKSSHLKLVGTVNFYQVYTRSPGSTNIQNSISDIVEITSVFRVMYEIVQNYSADVVVYSMSVSNNRVVIVRTKNLNKQSKSESIIRFPLSTLYT